MTLAELLADNDDRRSLDQVLADIEKVLGPTNDADSEEIDHTQCGAGDFICDACYDAESEAIARSYFTPRAADAIVLQWSVDVFVLFRAEALNADRGVSDPSEWLQEHRFDEVEQSHIWLECDDPCPVCRGEEPYRERMRPLTT